MPKPSPAMVVAVVALLSSLTGGAVAATVITGKNVKNSSLTGADVKDRALTGRDLKPRSVGADRLTPAARAALKGATGAAGATGAVGAPGPSGLKGDQGAPGVGAITTSHPAGLLSWGVFDQGTNTTSGSVNGGFAYNGVTGDTPRPVVVQTALPAHLPGGTSGRFEALHVCYRATAGTNINTVTASRYRGDDVDPTGLQQSSVLLSDTTERSDTACRRYPVTGDGTLRAGDTVLVALGLNVFANGNVNANRLRILSVALETASA